MTSSPRSVTLRFLVTLCMCLAACSSDHHPSAPPTTSAENAPSASIGPTTPSTARPKPRPKPKPARLTTNPLTGTGAVPHGPVLAVKIDDTAHGRPQINIDQADIVYIEQAEGGLSRLVAVYAGRKPVVGAVRSVRASDAELLTQYGPIVLVASGGGGDSLRTLDRSIVRGAINDRGSVGFARNGRSVPYNLTADLARISAANASRGGVRNVGFTWSRSGAISWRRPSGYVVSTVVGSTDVTFVYSNRLGRYVRRIYGVPQHANDGAYVSTPNVIVAFCKIDVHPQDVDVNGNPSSYTNTVGSGRVAIFRNGKRIDGTWSRPHASSPIVFKDRSGTVIPLAPGGAWFALVGSNAPLR